VNAKEAEIVQELTALMEKHGARAGALFLTFPSHEVGKTTRVLSAVMSGATVDSIVDALQLAKNLRTVGDQLEAKIRKPGLS
jgi:hypothetical protein